MSEGPSRAPSSGEKSVSSIAVSAVSFIGGVVAVILGLIQLATSTHSRRSIGILIIGVALAFLAALLWQQQRIRDLARKIARLQIPVPFVALLALFAVGIGLVVVGSSTAASGPTDPKTSASPPDSPTVAPSLSPSAMDVPSTTATPDPSPTATTTSAPPTSAPPPPPAQNVCPDTLSVPPNPPTTTFLITLKVTCPVASGNQLLLVAEIANADGHGTTEYYLVTKWIIRTDTSDTQSYQSHASTGPQRTYYVISVTSDQLKQITNPGNTLSDGGHYSLSGAAVVSSKQPNQVK